MLNSFKKIRPVGNYISTKKVSPTCYSLYSYLTYYCNSGTAALAATIVAACKLKPEIKTPEIIIPAYACPDLISAIVYAKAMPVLLDLKKNTPEISLELLEKSITNNTVAIVSVRFFGITEKSRQLLEIAKKYKLIVIEDSAQGFPVENIDTYWHGDFIIISFGRGKPVNLLGGGAVLSRNKKLMDLLPIPSKIQASLIDKIKYKLKLFLYNRTINPIVYGFISRLPGLKLGQTIYKKLDDIECISRSTVLLLNSNLNTYKTRKTCQNKIHSILQNIDSTKIIDIPFALNHDMSQPLLRYPILIKDPVMRSALFKELQPYGASIMYQQPLYNIDIASQYIKKNYNNYPNATQFSSQLITLPTHEDIDSRILNIFEVALKTI